MLRSIIYFFKYCIIHLFSICFLILHFFENYLALFLLKSTFLAFFFQKNSGNTVMDMLNEN